MNIPANLKYTQDDEWVRIEGEFAFVGITDYAQHALWLCRGCEDRGRPADAREG